MTADDGVITHAAAVALLPEWMRNDFLPLAEQDFAFVCAYPRGSSGFLVNHGALLRSMADLERSSA